MNDTLMDQLERLANSQESLLKTYVRYKTALRLIAEYKGKTLLGGQRYDEGANAAFEQCAAIAAAALDEEQ